MPDLETKTEETEQTESTEDKTTEEEKESTEVLEANAAFDKKVEEDLSGESDTADDKTAEEQKAADDKGAEDKADEKAKDDKTEDDTGETKAKEDDKTFNPSLLERAAKVGLTAGQAMSYSSEADLEATVSIFEKNTKTDTTDKTKDEPEKFDCGLSKDEYEPALVDMINKIGQENLDLKASIDGMTAKSTKDAEAAKAAETEATKSADKAAETEYTKWLDGQFEGTGKDYEDLFGKGDIASIAEAEFSNRSKVAVEIQAIAAGYKATNREVPSKEELFKKAVQIVFPEKEGLIATDKTKTKLTNRSRQTVGRGSQSSEPLTVEEKITQANKEFDAKVAEELDDD